MVQKCVLLPMSTPLSYAVVGPVARGLAADVRIRVVVSARHGGAALARECLDAPHEYRSLLRSRFTAYDLALCPGFFYRSFRRTPLVQMFHGVSPKNYAVAKDVARFQRLFLTGEYHRRKFVRAGLLLEEDPRGIRVGMPKTDPLVGSLANRDLVALKFDLDPSLPLVAYAPTRSGSHGSSIDDQGLAVIDALAELPINLVVKLHDRSQRRFRRDLKIDYEAAIESRRKQSKRVRLWTGFDVIPLLAAADVLVSDLSSVANEFLLRDRPIVFLTVENHERKLAKSGARRFGVDDPHGLEWVRAVGEEAATPLLARAAVERALEDPSRRSPERRDRARIMFYNPGTATAVAVTETKRLLALA